MSSVAEAAILAAAGVIGGIVGSAGGIASLVSYPALLAVGIAPLPASVANIIAAVTFLPGSALASGPELEGRLAWWRRYAVVAAAGGAIGAVVLRSTPAGVFGRVVPFLVLAGSLALVFEPWLSARRERRSDAQGDLVLVVGLFAVCLYSGYFGAGAGVITLALLMLTVDRRMATANALKNVILGVASVASALTFILTGPIDWVAAVPLAAGMFVGSTLGPRIARRIPATVLRWIVALIGLGLAVQLFVAGG